MVLTRDMKSLSHRTSSKCPPPTLVKPCLIDISFSFIVMATLYPFNVFKTTKSAVIPVKVYCYVPGQLTALTRSLSPSSHALLLAVALM